MGVRAYEKTGFKESGRRRQSRRSGGELRDEIFMQCLSDEFESPVLGRTFAPDGPR
jgi:diamine N-acetyltransferase